MEDCKRHHSAKEDSPEVLPSLTKVITVHEVAGFDADVHVNFFRGFRFSLAWWAYTFTMTGAAVANIRYSVVVNNVVTKSLTVILCAVATLTVSSVLVTTIIHAFVLGDLFPNDIPVAISDTRPKTSRKWFHKRNASSDNRNGEKFLKCSNCDGKDIEASVLKDVQNNHPGKIRDMLILPVVQDVFHGPVLSEAIASGKFPNDSDLPPKNPRINVHKDKRFDSFKTWSRKLEGQITNLCGKRRETELDLEPQRPTEIEILLANRYFDALEGPKLDILRPSHNVESPGNFFFYKVSPRNPRHKSGPVVCISRSHAAPISLVHSYGPVFCLELKIYGQWMSGGKRRLSKVANPSNHLPIVGNFVGALLGAAMELKEGPIFFFAVGLAHYTLISLFLYFSLDVRINFFRGFRFSLAWWAYTFPVTGAAVANIRYSVVVNNVVTKSLTVILCAVATLTVSSVLVTTIIHAFVLGDLFPNDIPVAISETRPKTSRKWFHKRNASSDNRNGEKFLKCSNCDCKDIEASVLKDVQNNHPGKIRDMLILPVVQVQ
ncbi:unnamed protein product [Fraxinus pennsylvanica]|uniref:Uncharacterized protein n=1 Tax=Fraxinus pennsylvanica TaxID=56036 RepID=A0AAD1ZPW3_9LAMI|nr:unnamed protein product [Fraxinus pennsylvanica]